MKCRFCGNILNKEFIDLGSCPPSNAYLSNEKEFKKEKKFKLIILICENCWLLQTQDFNSPNEIFTHDYAYFSSTSKTFVKHAKDYFNKISNYIKLNNQSMVVEIASNDGYLLQNFNKADIPCLGIEPTLSTASVAMKKGIPTLVKFFNSDLANQLVNDNYSANLIIANNVFAHVPNINDFTLGLKKLLKNDGVITIEFPYLLNLIKYNQFDTIYHEHYSYFSLTTINQILLKFGLRIFDLEELTTHGGSIRIYICHDQDGIDNIRDLSKINKFLLNEKEIGIQDINYYQGFQKKVLKIKNDFLGFLNEQKKNGKLVIGFGAAAKANTLLNYSDIDSDLIPFICDSSISKQGKFMPGNHIPIKSPDILRKVHPDYLVIFPWNIYEEIIMQNSFLREFKTKFVIPLPSLRIIE